MVEVAQGEVWWAELPMPIGSVAGSRRPVVVVQGNPLNRSRLATVVCVPLTTNLIWESAPGNIALAAKVAGLPQDSVANASQIFAVSRALLSSRIGKLSPKRLAQILASVDVVLGR
ncbi:MAG: type II toxin-antitoxin system PemK/MazF family toxin [Gemmatimonadaceae bacterium]